MHPKEKSVVASLRKAEEKAERKKAFSVNLYTYGSLSSSLGIPFPATSDDVALKALSMLSNEFTPPIGNLYCIGKFCLLDGTFISCKPLRIVK